MGDDSVALSRKVLRYGLGAVLAVWLAKELVLDRPIFEVRTNYLHWSSTLPAVSVCRIPTNNQSNYLEQFLENLEWPGKRYCYHCSNKTNLPHTGYRKILRERVRRCRDLLTGDCSWNGRPLDCCNAFKHLPTKRGPCYSINSEMTGSRYKLEVSHYSKQGALSFSASQDIQIYLHDPKWLWLESGSRVRGGETLDLLYRARDSEEEDTAWLTSLGSRGCLLRGEAGGYPVYSESLCKLRCLAAAQAARCRCVHHLLPSQGNYPDCDLDGLICLDKYFNKKKENKLINKCKCLPSCVEIEIGIVWSNITKSNTYKRTVNLVLTTPPSEKLFIRGRYSLIDFFVMFATITRLFTEKTILDVLMNIFVKKKKKPAPSYQEIHYKNVLY